MSSNYNYDDEIDNTTGLPYLKNTNTSVLVSQKPIDEIINPIKNPEIDIFECVKCSYPNVLKKTPRRRRQTRVRHIRVDDVVWSSFKRYSIINNVDLNYGLYLLLLHAKTENIDYIINPYVSVTPNNRGGRPSKKNNKKIVKKKKD